MTQDNGVMYDEGYLKQEPSMSEWQSIETAPKTRHAILVHCEERRNTYVVTWNPLEEPPGWFHFGGGFLYECPSHWMPLPDPPETTLKDYLMLVDALPQSDGEIAK
jgi:hypothetical protein